MTPCLPSGIAGRGGEIVPGRCGESCSSRDREHSWLGWLGVIIAVLFLGSNYVVVKQFDSGDGEAIDVQEGVYVGRSL